VLKAFAKALIINDAGEILCLRRAADDVDRAGGWDFPGGTLEQGEGFTAAVIREAHEETGLDLPAPYLVYSKSEQRTWGTGVWLYYVQYVAGRPAVTLSFEHDEYQWMTAEALLVASDYPKHHEIIRFMLDNQLFIAGVPQATATGRALVLNEAGQMLLLRRSATDPFHPGTWDLPGGRAEIDEDIHMTAIRETHEETGLSVQLGRPVFAISRRRPEGTGTWAFFVCTVADPQIRLSDEHDSYEWIAPADLPSYTTYDVLLQMHTFVHEHHLLEG
jgi:mutator protein MutT